MSKAREQFVDSVSAEPGLSIDGANPLTTALAAAVESACMAAESDPATVVLPVYVSGAPEPGRPHVPDVTSVSKWERALRRLERLGVTTVAIASGDCGGAALDALLATDYRIAAPGTRLIMPVDGEATWPGMALFRLVQQAGVTRARRTVLFGAPIDAGDGVGQGLLDEVADEPAKALIAVTEAARGRSGPELAIRRQLMFDASSSSFEDALGRHLAACDRALRRSAFTPERES